MNHIHKITFIITYGIISASYFCCAQQSDNADASSSLQKMSLSQVKEMYQNKIAHYYRISENDRFKFYLWGWNNEGEVVPDNLLIKDKSESDVFYVSKYDGVWDIAYDKKTNALFIGIRIILSQDMEKIEQEILEFADSLDISKDSLMMHTWELSDMCGGCPTFTMLEKINLHDFSVVRTKILGGEEIKVEGNSVLLTQYTSEIGTYYCWKRNSPHDYDCNNLRIKVLKINSSTLNVEKEYFVKEIGNINNVYNSFKYLNDRSLWEAIEADL